MGYIWVLVTQFALP